jgi:hypothetical protein
VRAGPQVQHRLVDVDDRAQRSNTRRVQLGARGREPLPRLDVWRVEGR